MLRVAVEGGGCSGFQYRFDLVDAAEADDLKVERDGAAALVDVVSLALLNGLGDRLRRRAGRRRVPREQPQRPLQLRLRRQLLDLTLVPSVAIAAALAAVALLATGAAVAEPIETFVEAPGPLAPLKGTLLTPADNPHAPVVLIIPGSGPTDRDGDNPMGVRAAPYRLLAEALAADGIASARIDKRGMFASGPAVKNGDQVTIGDYASDVHAWVASLKAKTGARCIWVLGHSEGALVAEAAAQQPEGICGLILVSGFGRRFGDVLAQQLKDNPANAPILADALEAIAALEAGRHVDTSNMNPALLPLFRPSVQDYLIDLMAQELGEAACRLPRAGAGAAGDDRSASLGRGRPDAGARPPRGRARAAARR